MHTHWAAGDAHSLALLSSGLVTAWGDNTYGQTTLPSVLLPTGYWIYNPSLGWTIVYIQPPPVLAIAAGRNHNLVVMTNHTVVAWGDDTYGESDVPATLTNVVAVAGGYAHSVALCADGTVTAWGDDSYGQTNVPAGLTNVVAVTAGDFNTLALLANGSVVGWGDNSYGQLNVPATATNAVAIASGYYHSLALTPAPKVTRAGTSKK
jgi:alpha-tubulin suppressor-like RCC1 family protein